MSVVPRAQPSLLTPAQRRLFDSAPDVPSQAAAAACKAMGEASFRHLTWEEMLSIATIGAMEATLTFDPSQGASYPVWAFFAAVRAVLDNARGERRQHTTAKAMIRASVLAYFGQVAVGVQIGVDTEESLTNKLHNFTNPVVGVAMLEVATVKPTTGGQDEIVEMEAAAQAGDALRQVMASLPADERRMIELRFVERRPLTEVAPAMGVEARGYATFVRRFHEVMGRIRKGLEKLGVTEMPPWIEGVSGRALGDDDTARKPGSGL